VLARTDAALGQAVVTEPRVPPRIRQALNVESGLNDGICVPLLFAAVAVADVESEISEGAAPRRSALPYLASHLTFPEIASRLFISRNIAKTEAVAIYRKFGISSRSEAIERAVEVGLLESSVLPPRLDLTQDG